MSPLANELARPRCVGSTLAGAMPAHTSMSGVYPIGRGWRRWGRGLGGSALSLLGRLCGHGALREDGPLQVVAYIGRERPDGLADFYRKVWARGTAGVVVPLDLSRSDEVQRVEITSANRLDHLRLKSSL